MRMRLQLAGGVSLAVAALLFFVRGRILRFLEKLAADAAMFGRTIVFEWRGLPSQDLWSIAALVCVASALRIPLLSQPMRYDEAYSVTTYASRPLYIGLALYTQPNNHLFHTFFMHVAYVLFGNHPWALRMPAFFAGLLLIPATYIAARVLYRTEGAILGAALAATSSVLIDYSTSARGYSLVCLFTLLLIVIAAYLIHNPGWFGWLLFSVFAALGFYTIPIMLYPVVGVGVWVLLEAIVGDAEHPRRVISGLLAAGILTAVLTIVLYSPVFAVSGPSSVFANKIVKPLSTGVFLKELPVSLLSTWRYWNRGLPLVLITVLATGFAVSLLLNFRCSRFRIPLPLALVASIAPILLVQRVVPFERVWTFALPLYFVASTAGLALAATWLLSRIPIRHGMSFFAAAICLWSAWYVRDGKVIYATNEGRGMQETAIYLKSHLTTGDSVLMTLTSFAPLEYYFLKHDVPIVYLNAPASHRLFVVVNQTAGETPADVFAAREIEQATQLGRPVGQFDTVVLYEVPAKD